MLDFRKLVVSYAVDLTEDHFMALNTLVENTQGDNPVIAALEAIEGVRVTEMSPHFGASVFIDIDAENDTPETHERIADVLGNL